MRFNSSACSKACAKGIKDVVKFVKAVVEAVARAVKNNRREVTLAALGGAVHACVAIPLAEAGNRFFGG
ncbi:hypothetical protein [Actinacidiphila sp. bgisy160]|uniref:hypothetical protein n=1 Tax=Actinacidiphila sp. bgisy160 TaxID=3413796 RepID=UPI003D74133E